MRILRKIAVLLAVLSIMTLFAGCDEINDLIQPDIKKKLDAAAETGKPEEVVRVIDDDVAEGNYNVHYTVYAADLCMELNDYESAEELLNRLCLNIQHSEAINGYFRYLSKSGQLDKVSESFPSYDSLTLFEKPLSEYSQTELESFLAEKGDDGKLSCALYPNDNKGIIPYDLTSECTPTDLWTAAGFTEKQADVLLTYRYVTIKHKDDGWETSAKMSEYAAFSQHPDESGINKMCISDGRAELEFYFEYDKLQGCELHYTVR